MVTGKAYSKSLRGHYLVESALTLILINHLFVGDSSIVTQDDSAVDTTKASLEENEITELKTLFIEITKHQYNLVEMDMPAVLYKFEVLLEDLKAEFSLKNRTAKLWIQYLDYVDLVRTFLHAERSCNWDLHLYTVSKMMNLIAAAGHTNYIKSCRVHLQQMLELPEKNAWLHERLSAGLHTIRRSYRYWDGISTDQAIEQCMMRELKSRGGLTHGRGLTESVRLTWVETMPICAAIHTAMKGFTDSQHSASDDEHDELGRFRVARDCMDLKKIVEWFTVNNPFKASDGRLRSLSTGIACNNTDLIDCDTAEEVGDKILKAMDDKFYPDCRVKKVECAKTLASLSTKVEVADKKLPVDAAVLFSRLLIVLQRQPQIAPLFNHELTALPASFFKNGMMRKVDKSVLAKYLKSTAHSEEEETAAVSNCYVVDGGWLLHKVKWQPGSTIEKFLGSTSVFFENVSV